MENKTNREYLAAALSFSDYSDRDAARVIADFLVEITDEDDCSLAVIYGKDLDRLADALGEECADD